MVYLIYFRVVNAMIFKTVELFGLVVKLLSGNENLSCLLEIAGRNIWYVCVFKTKWQHNFAGRIQVRVPLNYIFFVFSNVLFLN